MICIHESEISTICATPPLKIFQPGQRCIDLTLSRMDDIGQKTGFYNCLSRAWFPIPGLEGSTKLVEPSPTNIPSATTCLSAVAAYLNANSVAERDAGYEPAHFDIRVLTCGITLKSKIHPSRQYMVNPAQGVRVTAQELMDSENAAAHGGLLPKTRRIRRKRIKTIRKKNKQ
jgi:hypothetical protein